MSRGGARASGGRRSTGGRRASGGGRALPPHGASGPSGVGVRVGRAVVGARGGAGVARRRAFGRIVGAFGVRGGERGQGTVEFAVVTAAFLGMLAAFGMLWRCLESGLFVEHALLSASHHVQLAAPGSVADVFLY